MSAANPVETKVETAAKVVDAAAALAGAPAPVEAVKAGWWAFRNPKKFGIVAGSTALALAVGAYGWKYLTTTPPKVVAQADTTVAPVKTDEPLKPPTRTNEIDLTLPELPPVTAPKPTGDKHPIDVPAITVSRPAPDPELPNVRTPDSPRPARTPELELPVVKSPASSTDTGPAPLILPPTPGTNGPEIKKPASEPDLFKAPDALPAAVTDRKTKTDDKDTMPVIRIGGMGDPMPPAVPKTPAVDIPPPPPVPSIEVPGVSTPPTPKPGDLPPVPMTPKVELPPIKIDEPPPTITTPAVGPSPKIDTPPLKDKSLDVPTIKIDTPPVKSPTISDPPTIRTPGIDNPPPPPLTPKVEKRDMYEEDWHSQREGDTYAIISKEYYKTPDYAAALEAYNKERKKSGERIVRVPPLFVLEEQFPNLIGQKNEKPDTLEARPTGNVKFEPVSPKPMNERPAPPAAPVSTSEEYRVKAEAGETIREIARKVYGNPESWKKLWDLNPNLDPTQPIPTGTTIRLGK